MPTLAAILADMPTVGEEVDPKGWTNVFEAQLRLKGYYELEWPESDDPGTADDFVEILQRRLNAHLSRGTDNEYRLLVLIAFYRYFYSESKTFKFKTQAHEQQFLGKNGLRGAIGRTIEEKYFRPVIVDAAHDQRDGIAALHRFPRRPLLILCDETELFRAVFEARESDVQEHAKLAENLDQEAITRFFNPDSIDEDKMILLINYIKCLAGVAPFQTISSQVWERCFLHGIAVKGAAGELVRVISVKFIPRLNSPDPPIQAHSAILSDAIRARRQLLYILKQYNQELYDTILPCEIHIEIAPEVEGKSITLFIALILLMQATCVLYQAIDDVRVVVTGDLGDKGIIGPVNDVNIKIKTALEDVTRPGQEKRLLMLVPEANRAEALKGLKDWKGTPISTVLHKGGPLIALEGQQPSVEVISYPDLTHLFWSQCLLDFPGGLNFIRKEHHDWDDKKRYGFFQILMETATTPIEYKQSASADPHALEEVLRDEWLSRQPIFLNEKDYDAAQEIKKSFSKVERLIKAQEYEQALKVLNESVLSPASPSFFWKKRAEKLEQEVAEAEKLKQQKKAIQDQLNLQRELKELQQQQIKAEQNRLSLQQEVEEVHNQREKLQNRLVKQGWWIIIISILITGLILILGTPLFLSYFRFGAPSELTVKTDELKILKAGAFAFLTVEVENPSALTLEYEWGVEYGKVKFSPDSPFAEYTAPSTIVEDDGILQDTAILKVKNNGKTIFISNPIQIFVSAP